MVFFHFLGLLSVSLFAISVFSADPPTCDGISATRRTVGYYDTNYAGTECGQYPETLVAAGYTHINAAYAWIDPDTFKVAYMTGTDANIWSRLTALKETNPGLQVWLSIGGWMMNGATPETVDTMEYLVSHTGKEEQERFTESLLSVLEEYGFDGVDFDWAHPSSSYSDFLYALRLDLRATGFTYGLSCTLPRTRSSQDDFDIGRLQHSVDWINVMNYDLYKNGQTSDPTTFSAHSNMTEFDDSLSILWENDVDPAKVTLGLGFYGRSYTLNDASCASPGCGISGFGPPGMCDDAYGYLSYDEVQSIVDDDSTTTYFDEDAAVNIATYGGNQWMSYDDKESFAKKVEYANAHCIGGLNVWGIDLDRQGHAIEALSNSTKELERSAEEKPDPADPLSECQWTECIDQTKTCSGGGLGGFTGGQSCQEGCPDGTTESWRTYGNGACDAPGKYRLFCCPNSGRPDSCKTRKDTQLFETRCVGRCTGSEVKIGIDTSNCLSGWNEICCTRSDALTSMQQCAWTTTCSSSGKCPDGKPNKVTSSAFGDGGEPCTGSDQKSLCCSEPSPYGDCKWDMGPFGASDCQGSCSTPYTTIAASTEGCTRGQKALCCARISDDVSTSYAKAVLYEFLDNPECPIPQSADDDEDDMSVVGTQNIGLAKRDSLGSFPNSDGVHAWTAAIMGVSAAATVIRRAWDASIGSDTLNSWEIFKLIASRPDEDPASVIGQSLCDFTHARHDFKELDETATEMCVPAWSSNHTSSNDLEKRVFRADLRTTQPTSSTGGSRINTGALLHRILETDDVPFLYSRVARYRHRERLAPVGNQRVGSFMVDENGEPIVTEQVNLEVVYDLRNARDLQERPDTDIFAVFHFHIDNMSYDPEDETREEPMYPGVRMAHVFHAQQVYNANPTAADNSREWRVDFGLPPVQRNPNPTERALIYECPPPPEGEAQTNWYPGDPGTRRANALSQRFGVMLRDRGILNPQTIHNWVVDNPQTQEGHWEWDRANRPRNGEDYPNSGRMGDTFELPPTDMRPNDRGGDQNWPWREPPPPPSLKRKRD